MDESDRLSALRAELMLRLGRSRYDLWVGDHVQLDWIDNSLTVTCSSRFELQGLKRRLNACLVECCQSLWGREVSIKYVERPQPNKQSSPASGISEVRHDEYRADQFAEQKKDLASELGDSTSKPELSSITEPGVKEDLEDLVASQATRVEVAATTRRNVRHGFDNFVVGPCNELAYRTARMIAGRPGHYGPLLIYGQPGVGKTHLLHAMATGARTSSRRPRTLCIRAEQFTSEFLEALSRRALSGFRQKVRETDVLLVDDIHFFQGKIATLDEVIHTTEALRERGKQVVFTADRSPGDYRSICPDLVSRISDGLAIEMELPDFGTRVELVRLFLQQMDGAVASLINDRVIEVIATQVLGSARYLKGAINRLVVASQAKGEKITPTSAEAILKEYTKQNSTLVRLTDIQRAVCQVFGVEANSLTSSRKTRALTEPRILAMWLSCKLTTSALGEIGAFYGRRSHSTVISAQRKVEQMVSRGTQLRVCETECSVDEALRRVEQLLRTA